jgi:hypothetical protein
VGDQGAPYGRFELSYAQIFRESMIRLRRARAEWIKTEAWEYYSDSLRCCERQANRHLLDVSKQKGGYGSSSLKQLESRKIPCTR